MELSEEETKSIKILQEEHDVMINPKLEAKYTSDEVIEALYNVIMLIRKQQKEIEEKSTIIMAGAEKVKQLEKGNRSLMESRKKWKNRYYKEKAKNKECISKDKIREKIDKYRKKSEKLHSQELWNEPEDSIKDFKYNHYLEAYKELLEENKKYENND